MTRKTAVLLRLGLVAAIVTTGLWDIITFLNKPEFQTFEANPLFLLTKSASFVVAVKCTVLVILTWFLLSTPKRLDETVRYALILSGLYLTLFQYIGGSMNQEVQRSMPNGPDESLVLPPSEARRQYVNRVVLPMYFPIMFGVVAFLIYKHGNYQLG